jgi:aldehyde dehydrogenase (NAD+)
MNSMRQVPYDHIYIDGQWSRSAGAGMIPVLNPATEEHLGAIPQGAVEDVTRAVSAARQAFPGWSASSPDDRAKFLAKAGELLRARAQELAALITADVGTPANICLTAQVQGSLATFEECAELVHSYDWRVVEESAVIRRAPVGVVAAITPWNFPLGMAVDKVAPALLAGCTVVLKPSELAPLAAWMLTDALAAVGLPPGVFNLVSGTGSEVGEALINDPGVDMVSFTGSTNVGKRISRVASERMTRTLLELGGKSAQILLEDADLDAALPNSVTACYFNSGQACASLSRLLVPRHLKDEVVDRIRIIVDRLSVGDPTSNVDLGPVISAAHRAQIHERVAAAVRAGATIAAGSASPPSGLSKGFFVSPIVLTDVDNSMPIAQEEVFGPVLSIITFDDDEDAVRIANDSRYGLSGAVWSSSTERAERIATRLRTGTVRINGARLGRTAPFGGFKQSGVGRSRGRYGVDEYTELQAITGLVKT